MLAGQSRVTLENAVPHEGKPFMRLRMAPGCGLRTRRRYAPTPRPYANLPGYSWAITEAMSVRAFWYGVTVAVWVSSL